MTAKSITTLRLTDADYPERLKQISNPPKQLHVQGSVSVLHSPQLAIVGCRNMTTYGATHAYQFAKALAEIGITVTSGLARGIDTLAHQGALAAPGQTIAVLGTGLNHIYPAQNQKLAEAIVQQGGAITSEFPPMMTALPYNFPKRNRIISALSLGVLVIEAAEKSGSLITARLALEQNREVFAIPGPINQTQSRGCHRLIQDGATLVQSIPDLLREIQEKLTRYVQPKMNAPIKNQSKHLQTIKKHDNAIKKSENILLTFLTDTPIPLDLLAVQTNMAANTLHAELLNLELAGAVKLVTGGYIIN